MDTRGSLSGYEFAGSAVETLLRAVFGDVLHRALVQVADQCQVLVPLGCRPRVTARSIMPLASSQLSRKIFVAPVTLHCPSTSMARRSKSSVNRDRGPAHGTVTWDHSVFPAGHPWDPRVQVGLELAAVEMAPGARLGVIVQRQRLGAVRARLYRVLRVLGPHIHTLPCDVQLDAAHGPRRLQAQQVLIQPGVLHGGLLMRPASYPVRLPMRNPDAPQFLSP